MKKGLIVSNLLASLAFVAWSANLVAQQTPPESRPPVENTGEGIAFNAVDTEITKLIQMIHQATGKSFILDDQVKGRKITILSEKKMTPDEAYQTFLSALEVAGYTVVPTAGGALKIVPLKDSLQEPIPIHTDDTPNTDSFITRLITLKHVNALDISSAIKPLISKEGNLFAYPATNSLIVTDSGTNIDRLMKIIGQMDTQGPEQVVEMVTLKNSNAKEMAAKIQQLYVDAQQAAKKPSAAGKGSDFEDIPAISKVIADDRTNTVIILASKRAIPKVRDLILRLDRVIEGPQGKVHVHPLRHAEAKKMAEVLSSLTSSLSNKSSSTPSSSGSTTPGKPSGGAPIVAEFEGGVKVTADESTNSLIITATKKDYDTLVSEVIDKLDIPRRQVYVEVVIMELSVGKSRDIGVNLQAGKLFSAGGNDLIGLGSVLGGVSGGISAALSGAGAAGVISKGTFSLPVLDSSTGTTKNISVPSFGALVTAIQTEQSVNVLSTPNILTLDNEEAEILVGDEIPVPTGSTLTTGGNQSFNITRQNTGIILKITPQVNEGDMVKMKIKQELTDVKPAASTEVLTKLGPTTSKRSVNTVVVAKDQQTIVIGGLIGDKTTMTQQKIPFLGDIPLLGNLFKRKTREVSKTNLLVFLRPYIIHDTPDFLKILQKKVEERNMFVEQNYGKAHQKAIRETVRSHSAELLEFKKEIQERQYDYEKKGKKLDERE